MAGDNADIPVQREKLKRKSAASRRGWHRKLREGLEKRRCALPGEPYDDATNALVTDLRGYLDEFEELANDELDIERVLETLGTSETKLANMAAACPSDGVVFIERPSMELAFGSRRALHKLSTRMIVEYDVNVEASDRTVNGVRMEGLALRATKE